MNIFTLTKAICSFAFVIGFFVMLESKGSAQHLSETNKANAILETSQQLVLVTTKTWDTVEGTLRRFERNRSDEAWREIGSVIEIVVGRTGLAWGRGLHPTNPIGPQKVEGDGKSPAGIFKLSSAFGFAPVEKMKSLKLPYLHVTEAIECVDDVKSIRYNSIVDRTHIINPDWNSSEKMRQYEEQYPLGVLVDHNVSPRIAGKGSCIFIHIWKGDGSGTAGCTAMEKSDMEKFIRWLDAKENPVLVQLPDAELRRLKTEWHLPGIKTDSATK